MYLATNRTESRELLSSNPTLTRVLICASASLARALLSVVETDSSGEGAFGLLALYDDSKEWTLTSRSKGTCGKKGMGGDGWEGEEWHTHRQTHPRTHTQSHTQTHTQTDTRTHTQKGGGGKAIMSRCLTLYFLFSRSFPSFRPQFPRPRRTS